MTPIRLKQQAAFTLVELSIVIVILGLVVGGIIGGQALIRSAEMRSIVTQYTQFVTATKTFRDQYQALPGDMTNAENMWGTAAAPASCRNTASTGATCNGDGDGRLSPTSTSYETFRFWQHLANAELIEGNYNGVGGGGFGVAATKDNSPSGKMQNALWQVSYVSPQSFSTTMFTRDYGNTMWVVPEVYNLKPEEIWNIDKKLDDGKPATGTIALRSPITDCTDASTPTTMDANYQLSSTIANCGFLFVEPFTQ